VLGKQQVTTGNKLNITNHTMTADTSFITKDVADMISANVTMDALVSLPDIELTKGLMLLQLWLLIVMQKLVLGMQQTLLITVQ
jgi:hypothetical protein